MALSVKLSSSAMIRPFGFSFGRHNGLVQVSYPMSLGAPNSCLYRHYQQKHFSADSVSRRLSDKPLASNHLLNTRQMSSSNVNSAEPMKQAKDDVEPVLLSKESTRSANASQNDERPSEEQLLLVSNRLAEILPKFFKIPHDFSIYNPKIVFIDNIRNVQTVGLNQYAWQIAKVKMGAHFKYGKVNLGVLKITTHPEDGSVRVRWRIASFPGNSIVFAFWRFKLWNQTKSIDSHRDEWIDGFSIFHVGGDGLVYKHICDNVIPDTDKVTEKKGINLAVKLGIALGLIPAGFSENDEGGSFLSEILSIFF